MRVSSEDLGGLSMMSRSGGLKERAVAGRPWKVHFISWGRRWKSSEKRKASSEEKVCVWEREKGDKSARGRVGVCAWERGGEGDRKREIERKRERELNLSVTLDFICIRNIYDQNYNNEKNLWKLTIIPSVTRLTQRSWTGMRASGRPSAAVRKMETTSPMLEEIRYLKRRWALSRSGSRLLDSRLTSHYQKMWKRQGSQKLYRIDIF